MKVLDFILHELDPRRGAAEMEESSYQSCEHLGEYLESVSKEMNLFAFNSLKSFIRGAFVGSISGAIGGTLYWLPLVDNITDYTRDGAITGAIIGASFYYLYSGSIWASRGFKPKPREESDDSFY